MNYKDYFDIVDIAYRNDFINYKEKNEIINVIKHFSSRKQAIPMLKILQKYNVTKQQMLFIRQQQAAFKETTIKEPTIKEPKNPEVEKMFSLSTSISGPEMGSKIGNYEIIKLLGSGAMGSVYLAKDHNGQKVAIKKMLQSVAESRVGVKRFQKEVSAMKMLRHKNIIKIFDIGEEKGNYYFSMQYIEGKPLSDCIREKMSSSRIAKIVEKIARALEYAHSKNIIHRDIKPANIMISKSGEPVIMDFGLAVQVKDNNRLTKTGSMIGTLAYMPPEQVQGNKKHIDHQTDVYALGATMYEMMTGRIPFSGSQLVVLKKIIHEDPIPPRELNNLIPDSLEKICLKAMAKDKEFRFLNSRDMAEDLERFLGGEKIEARLDRRVISKKGKQRIVTIAYGSGFLLLMILINLTFSSGSANILSYEKKIKDKTQAIEELKVKVTTLANKITELRGIIDKKSQMDNGKTIVDRLTKVTFNHTLEKKAILVLSNLKSLRLFQDYWSKEHLVKMNKSLRFVAEHSYQERTMYLKADIAKTVWGFCIDVIRNRKFLDKDKVLFMDLFLELSHNYTPLDRDRYSRQIRKRYAEIVLKTKFNEFMIVKNNIRTVNKEQVDRLPEQSYKYFLLADYYDEQYKKSGNLNDRKKSLEHIKKSLKLNVKNPGYIQEMSKFYKSLFMFKEKLASLNECRDISKIFMRHMPIFKTVID
ncbi:serine/threonine protein kinase [Candidatus Uabimicrobium sp. HlEnr_7]|uniref:serine/threonine protein kinase n=1 Tax=Candidatus Uabimicrobium helgolandensis TaxID=3095367 RepID=UPI0035592288